MIPMKILVQFSSVTQSCPTLSDPIKWSIPRLPVHHQLQESTQTHVHWVSDAIQPSYPLSSFSSCPQSFPESESFPMSWLFALGGQTIGISAWVLTMHIQGWFSLGLTGLVSLQSKGLSESSPAPQFKRITSSVLSLLYVIQTPKPAMSEYQRLGLSIISLWTPYFDLADLSLVSILQLNEL